ncbi:MAG: hypothetical protein ACLFQX_08880 [Candidatus Kapaibacterium sp.]
MKKIIFVLFFLLIASQIRAENKVMLNFDWHQNKDAFNHGIIFSGYEVSLGYAYSEICGNNKFEIESWLRGGFNHGKDIIGLNLALTPIKVFYGWKTDWMDNITTYAGANFEAYYQLSLYPDLQMGHDFWITSYSVSPELRAYIPYRNDEIEIKPSNSILGLVSRPDKEKPEYIFSLRTGDIISDLHSNFRAGSLNLFNNLYYEMNYIFDKDDPFLSVGYSFRFLNYFDEPEFDYLNHSLNFKYYWGEK